MIGSVIIMAKGKKKEKKEVKKEEKVMDENQRAF